MNQRLAGTYSQNHFEGPMRQVGEVHRTTSCPSRCAVLECHQLLQATPQHAILNTTRTTAHSPTDLTGYNLEHIRRLINIRTYPRQEVGPRLEETNDRCGSEDYLGRRG